MKIFLLAICFLFTQCKERRGAESEVSQDGTGLSASVLNPSLSWNTTDYCQCDCTLPGNESVYSRRAYVNEKIAQSSFQKCTDAAASLSKAIESKSFYFNLNTTEAIACMNRVKCYLNFSPQIIIDKSVFETYAGVVIAYPNITKTAKFRSDVRDSQSDYQDWLRKAGHSRGP